MDSPDWSFFTTKGLKRFHKHKNFLKNLLPFATFLRSFAINLEKTLHCVVESCHIGKINYFLPIFNSKHSSNNIIRKLEPPKRLNKQLIRDSRIKQWYKILSTHFLTSLLHSNKFNSYIFIINSVLRAKCTHNKWWLLYCNTNRSHNREGIWV